MILRPPRSTPLYSSAASDVYKRQGPTCRSAGGCPRGGARSTPRPGRAPLRGPASPRGACEATPPGRAPAPPQPRRDPERPAAAAQAGRRALAATLLARRPPRRALLHSSTRASGQNEHLSVLRGPVSSAAGNVGLTTAMCSRDRPPPGAPDGRDNGLISGASRPEGRRHLRCL